MTQSQAPNEKFMAAFEAATEQYKGTNSRLWDDKVIINLNPRDCGDEVHINKIEVIERGHRYGHEAMKFLSGLADTFGIAMAVEAIPTAVDVGYGAVDKLYGDSGFGPPSGPPRLRWREPAEQVQHKPKENAAMTAGPVAF